MTMSYTTLVGSKSQPGSIRSWLNWTLVDAEGCLLDAQNWIFNFGGLRAREMRSSGLITQTSGQEYTALPDGFLDPISLTYTDGYGEIPLVIEDGAIIRNRSYDTTGLSEWRPTLYGIFDERFQWDAKPDDAYSALALFYKQPDTLSTANKTNFLTNRYSHLLRSACLMRAAQMRQDDATAKGFQQEAAAFIASANALDDLSRRGAVNL